MPKLYKDEKSYLERIAIACEKLSGEGDDGGGGGAILNKVCHITIVDPNGLEPSVESYVTTIKDSYASATNGLILSDGTIDLMFNVDIEEGDETESYIDIVFSSPVDIVASDEVNCTFAKFQLGTAEYIITQTDLSQDASLTLTLSEADDEEAGK